MCLKPLEVQRFVPSGSQLDKPSTETKANLLPNPLETDLLMLLFSSILSNTLHRTQVDSMMFTAQAIETAQAGLHNCG